MGLIYSVSVLFFTFMIFRMYLKKDIRPYMTSRVVTLLTILGLLPYVNTVIIIATLGDAVVKFNEYRNLTNDTGFKPANIVMKLISCQMNANQPVYGCVKLSDDAGKHTGEMREVNACLVELGL